MLRFAEFKAAYVDEDIWIPWGGGVAIPEMLASLQASLWSIVFGIRLYKQVSHSARHSS